MVYNKVYIIIKFKRANPRVGSEYNIISKSDISIRTYEAGVAEAGGGPM